MNQVIKLYFTLGLISGASIAALRMHYDVSSFVTIPATTAFLLLSYRLIDAVWKRKKSERDAKARREAPSTRA